LKILLDTCAFLWIVLDTPNLSRDARALFIDPANEVYLSTVSIWEIMVKYSLGRLPLPTPPRQFIPVQRTLHHMESLSLDETAVLHLDRLPAMHQDPFDRMLVCQAIAHGMVILTPDAAITQYPIRTAW